MKIKFITINKYIVVNIFIIYVFLNSCYSFGQSINEIIHSNLDSISYYTKKNDRLVAFKFINESLDKANDSLDKKLHAKLFFKKAVFLLKSGDYNKADNEFYKGVDILYKSGDSLLIDYMYITKSNYMLHYVLETEQEDIYYDTIRLDSSIYFSKKILLKNKFKDFKQKRKTLTSLSISAQIKGDFKQAEKYSLEAFKLIDKVKNSDYYAFSMINLSSIYISQNDKNKAKKILKDNLNYLIDTKSRYLSDVYKNLEYINRREGKYKLAYEYKLESLKIKDSISELDQNSKIKKIEAKYSLEKAKEKYEKKQEISKIELENYKTFIYSLLFLVVLLVVFGLFVYYVIKQRQIMKSSLLQKEMKNELLNSSIAAKEKEREKVASILHDSVSAMLSSVGLHLSASKVTMTNIPESFTKAQEIVINVQSQIRDLSHSLVSPVLLKFGLFVAIDSLCKRYSNELLYIDYVDYVGDYRLQKNIEMKLYSIVEESINNIMKHSQASSCTVKCTRVYDSIIIIISDNGKGFDSTKFEEIKGFGLTNMKDVVINLGGEFNIFSMPNEGTRLRIDVPVEFL